MAGRGKGGVRERQGEEQVQEVPREDTPLDEGDMRPQETSGEHKDHENDILRNNDNDSDIRPQETSAIRGNNYDDKMS